MADTGSHSEGQGLSRRDMLRRSALVGGTVVWMAPAVQTIAVPAFANGSPAQECPPGAALSEITALLQCGGLYFWVKYNPQTNGGAPTECGPDINVAESNGRNKDLTCDAAEQAIKNLIIREGLTEQSSGGPSATVSDGALCLPVGCTVLAWTVHDGILGQGHHCAYQIGTGPVVYGLGANEALQVCRAEGGLCLSKISA